MSHGEKAEDRWFFMLEDDDDSLMGAIPKGDVCET